MTRKSAGEWAGRRQPGGAGSCCAAVGLGSGGGVGDDRLPSRMAMCWPVSAWSWVARSRARRCLLTRAPDGERATRRPPGAARGIRLKDEKSTPVPGQFLRSSFLHRRQGLFDGERARRLAGRVLGKRREELSDDGHGGHHGPQLLAPPAAIEHAFVPVRAHRHRRW